MPNLETARIVSASDARSSDTHASDTRASDWRQDFANLLEDMARGQEELLALLTEKRRRMKDRDESGMTALEGREAALGARLEDCLTRRAALLARAEQEGVPARDLKQLTASAGDDQRRALRQRCEEIEAHSRLLRHASFTNWILAQRSLLFYSRKLEILAAGGRLAPNNFKDGSRAAPGRCLDLEA